MKRTLLALIAPPALVGRYGCVSCTAVPIGVFWLAGVANIGYGLAGGVLDGLLDAGGLIAAGILLWLIAAVWAQLVIHGVESDLLHRQDSTRNRQVVPQDDDPDLCSQLRSDA